jgi:uncharacterized protein with FMN-binding domain
MTKRNQLFSTVLTLATGMNFALTPVAAVESVVYKDGTYTGTATVVPDDDEDFYSYDISVDVVIQDGKISNVAYSASNFDGNDTYATKAMDGTKKITGIHDLILQKQGTTGVDTVSGATCTSNAILTAVASALDKAVSTDNSGQETELKTYEGEVKYYTEDGKTLSISDLPEDIVNAKISVFFSDASDTDYLVKGADIADGSVTLEKTMDEEITYSVSISSDNYALISGTVTLDKEDTDEKQETYYVNMNIPYSDFYAAENPSEQGSLLPLLALPKERTMTERISPALFMRYPWMKRLMKCSKIK